MATAAASCLSISACLRCSSWVRISSRPLAFTCCLTFTFCWCLRPARWSSRVLPGIVLLQVSHSNTLSLLGFAGVCTPACPTFRPCVGVWSCLSCSIRCLTFIFCWWVFPAQCERCAPLFIVLWQILHSQILSFPASSWLRTSCCLCASPCSCRSGTRVASAALRSRSTDFLSCFLPLRCPCFPFVGILFSQISHVQDPPTTFAKCDKCGPGAASTAVLSLASTTEPDAPYSTPARRRCFAPSRCGRIWFRCIVSSQILHVQQSHCPAALSGFEQSGHWGTTAGVTLVVTYRYSDAAAVVVGVAVTGGVSRWGLDRACERLRRVMGGVGRERGLELVL